MNSIDRVLNRLIEDGKVQKIVLSKKEGTQLSVKYTKYQFERVL